MTISTLKNACMSGTVITVVSARTGRMLIQNAMKSSRAMCSLRLYDIQARIRLVGGDDKFATPYIYCYANEDDYKRLKESGDTEMPEYPPCNTCSKEWMKVRPDGMGWDSCRSSCDRLREYYRINRERARAQYEAEKKDAE